MGPCNGRTGDALTMSTAQTSKSGVSAFTEYRVPARGCEVSLISLERCLRLATVTSEENEGSSMIGRLRRPHKRTTGREPQKNYL